MEIVIIGVIMTIGVIVFIVIAYAEKQEVKAEALERTVQEEHDKLMQMFEDKKQELQAQESESALTGWELTYPIKKKRGRPLGSRNKSKTETITKKTKGRPKKVKVD